MIRKFLYLFAIANTGLAAAQDGTVSPYSFYGIGENRFKGVNEIKDMGSLAVYTDSLHMNSLNPASYGQLQRATLSLGASYRNTAMKSNLGTTKTTTGSFDYLTLSLPVAKKLGVAVGIMPYTFSGYKVVNQTQQNEMTVKNQFDGDGGINRTFLGVGYKITNNLSIGAEAAYLFGDITQTTIKFITDSGNGFPLDAGTRQVLVNDYSGFDFNFAVNYKRKISGKNWFHVNGTFSPETTLSNDLSSQLEIVRPNANEGYDVVDAAETITRTSDFINPMKYSLGIGIGNPFKWFVGAEYAYANTEAYNQNYTYDIARFEDSQKFSLGGFYTPKYNSYTSYFQTITYRGGFRFENTGLVLNNEKINDMAVHAGVGLPVGTYFSSLNIGLEYGKRGTKNNNLIQENYFSVSIGLSLNDRWFEKRKFN